MEVTEDTYVSTVWYVEDPEGNFLATLYKNADGRWRLTYRFRIYVDDKAHGSADQKQGATMVMNDGSDEQAALKEAKDGVEGMIEKLLQFGVLAGPVHRLEIEGSGAKMIEEMRKQPWCHVREEKLN